MYPFLETIQLRDGMFCRLPFHQSRMNRALQANYPHAEMIGLEANLLEQDFPKQGLYKCRVVYDKEIQTIEFLPYKSPAIRTLKVVSIDIPSLFYKSTYRIPFQDAYAQRGECDDVLMVKCGLLTDTSYCNIALWNGTEWITPRQPLVYGVNRASLLEDGLLLEQDISVNNLIHYSRIRLFNALNEFGSIEMELPGAIIY